MKRLKPNARCPTCGIEPRTLDVELGTYKRRGGGWGWRIRVTDPNGDVVAEAQAAARIAAMLYDVWSGIVDEAKASPVEAR